MSVALETRSLNKRFGAVEASCDISLTLNTGEIHALIGPNGAGKSTLIAQIAGGLRPDAGSVWLAGRDVTRLSVAQRARAGLGRTFQISALAMEDSVLDNVLLGALGQRRLPLWRPANQGAAREQAQAALTDVGLWDRREIQVAALSHGERRLLEVAIALTLSPTALVMDEPMAGLGAEGSARLTSFLSSLRDRAPILLVEHDMQAVFALADRISVLVAGRIIATGTPTEIRANAAARTAYLGEEA